MGTVHKLLMEMCKTRDGQIELARITCCMDAAQSRAAAIVLYRFVANLFDPHAVFLCIRQAILDGNTAAIDTAAALVVHHLSIIKEVSKPSSLRTVLTQYSASQHVRFFRSISEQIMIASEDKRIALLVEFSFICQTAVSNLQSGVEVDESIRTVKNILTIDNEEEVLANFYQCEMHAKIQQMLDDDDAVDVIIRNAEAGNEQAQHAISIFPMFIGWKRSVCDKFMMYALRMAQAGRSHTMVGLTRILSLTPAICESSQFEVFSQQWVAHVSRCMVTEENLQFEIFPAIEYIMKYSTFVKDWGPVVRELSFAYIIGRIQFAANTPMSSLAKPNCTLTLTRPYGACVTEEMIDETDQFHIFACRDAAFTASTLIRLMDPIFSSKNEHAINMLTYMIAGFISYTNMEKETACLLNSTFSGIESSQTKTKQGEILIDAVVSRVLTHHLSSIPIDACLRLIQRSFSIRPGNRSVTALEAAIGRSTLESIMHGARRIALHVLESSPTCATQLEAISVLDKMGSPMDSISLKPSLSPRVIKEFFCRAGLSVKQILPRVRSVSELCAALIGVMKSSQQDITRQLIESACTYAPSLLDAAARGEKLVAQWLSYAITHFRKTAPSFSIYDVSKFQFGIFLLDIISSFRTSDDTINSSLLMSFASLMSSNIISPAAISYFDRSRFDKLNASCRERLSRIDHASLDMKNKGRILIYLHHVLSQKQVTLDPFILECALDAFVDDSLDLAPYVLGIFDVIFGNKTTFGHRSLVRKCWYICSTAKFYFGSKYMRLVFDAEFVDAMIREKNPDNADQIRLEISSLITSGMKCSSISRAYMVLVN